MDIETPRLRLVPVTGDGLLWQFQTMAGEPVGEGGLEPPGENGAVRLRFSVIEEARGKGYATEAAAALVAHAFRLEKACSVTSACPNPGGQAILRGFGFTEKDGLLALEKPEQRPVRYQKRALPRERAEEILCGAEYGILSTADEDGQPYGVPLSHVLIGGCVYFHCATSGHKLDNLKRNPRCCFTAVSGTKPVYDGGFSTYYQSAAAFGYASAVTNEDEKTEVLRRLCEKYLPGDMDKFAGALPAVPHTCVMRVIVAHLSGKAKE